MTYNNELTCLKFKEKSYTNSRRDKTFPVFTNNTDEKDQTIKVTSSFLDNYLLPGLIAI